MHRLTYGAAFLLVVGCGGTSQPLAAAPSDPAVAAAGGGSLERAPDSGQVDRVGSSDGALQPDGTNDLGFVARIEGPVVAAFLVTVDDKGTPDGKFQADTLVDQNESPKELGAKQGNKTAGLGVVEDGKVLNAPNGSLPELAAGTHRLGLYISPAPEIQAGTRLRVYTQKPGRELVAWGTVTQ
jgi:hypothetical protein